MSTPGDHERFGTGGMFGYSPPDYPFAIRCLAEFMAQNGRCGSGAAARAVFQT
jgi:hypothetical protein